MEQVSLPSFKLSQSLHKSVRGEGAFAQTLSADWNHEWLKTYTRLTTPKPNFPTN